jgi:hypothetical protein
LVPLNPIVNVVLMPHPAALPAPCADRVDPFSVAEADWYVRITLWQFVKATAGQA